MSEQNCTWDAGVYADIQYWVNSIHNEALRSYANNCSDEKITNIKDVLKEANAKLLRLKDIEDDCPRGCPKGWECENGECEP